MVSGFLVSGFHGFWFHPNRGRYRYRYRYRRPATRDIRPATIDRDARVSDTAGRSSRVDFAQIAQIFLFCLCPQEGRDERLLVRGGHAAVPRAVRRDTDFVGYA